MEGVNKVSGQNCPECGQALHTLWDYPNNEVWCLRCGNRFYQTVSSASDLDAQASSRLLILDADAPRREALAGHFANLGYSVTPVCHPRQALEAASFRCFDLALISADWPGFDTAALIGKLRRQLGGLRFVIYIGDEVEQVPEGLAADQDIVCLRTNLAERRELESALDAFLQGMLLQSGSAKHSARRQFAPAQ
jgi:CheY-like chemotaxis protein